MTQYSGKIIRRNPVLPTQQSASGVWTTEDAAVAVRNNSWPVPGVPDPISRSLRFRSSASAFLSRTPAVAGNRQVMTFSWWMKLGNTTGAIFGAPATTNPRMQIYYNGPTDGRFELYQSDSGGTQVCYTLTTARYRDPSAWYHFVIAIDTTQATAANRIKWYVNGVQLTAFDTAAYPAQNTNMEWNAAAIHNIGRQPNGGSYFDGYLTEINFIDGQALTPSSFGTTDAFTGAWIPMPYRGTYGTNGFYIDFRDNTSTTTLGNDYSGNSNNWTTNNISLTAGVTYDSMLDVPTPWVGYSATTDTTAVTRGNYCTWNPLSARTTTLTNGNLAASTTTGMCAGTIAVSSGKWYWECTPTDTSAQQLFGIISASNTAFPTYPGQTSDSYGYYAFNGNKYTGGSATSYGASYGNNDVIGVALDLDAGTLVFYKNGVSQGTAYSGLSGTFLPAAGDGATNAWVGNFGQRPFSYSVPSGFKTLVTTNLPTPTILNGAQYMAASTYTGNNSTNNIVNSGNNAAAVSFRPDLVWMKCRSNVVSHVLDDSVRGPGLDLFSNLTNAETSTGILTSFNSNGFSLGPDGGGAENGNGLTYVAWQWQAGAGSSSSNTNGSITSTVSFNTTAGFSVVTYTGNGTNGATVGHGLGVTPAMVIYKARGTPSGVNGNWLTWHSAVSQAIQSSTTIALTGFTGALYLNLTSSSSTYGFDNQINQSSLTYVAYCWAAVAGYSAFGSYTGNGSSDGPFVFAGFRPRFVLVKDSSAGTGQWVIWDTARDSMNVVNNALFPNSSSAESTGSADLDILSNGFKLRRSATNFNASGVTYIYAVFAENPFKYSNAR